MQQVQHDIAKMVKEIEDIEIFLKFEIYWCLRKLLGQDLGSCRVEELQDIDDQLERSLRSIRARKALLFKEQIEQLKAKEKLLLEENARLSSKVNLKVLF
ncbi:hypothetical protein Pint_17346 [Pistacia integerrima]|uniref:Uncharacterized protein n=1 Tax=Pistacia integerrima TaxID=434235 RepID=A0ACC0Z1D8_9ROSI|nr:hypothetical protein Pint_17346 [Pistacia integerrima]